MNLCFYRMLTRANEDQPKPFIIEEPAMSQVDYFEHDPSPLATLTLQFFEDLKKPKANYWDSFCELNSSAPECKIYED